jgi:protein-tyrosine-phosphatase
MKVLFVCNANISRSQAAEAIFNHLAEGRHTAISAGTRVGSDEGQKLKDRHGAAGMVTHLKEIDIDPSEQGRNQLTQNMLTDVDKIIMMADPDTIPEYLLDDPRVIFWKINLDEVTPEAFRFARDQIKEKVTEFLRELL